MARARNIKPGFFRNADLAELPFETRLLFPGLWVLADREGRLEDRPKQIKMEIFPADNLDIDAMLQSLHDAGLILRYQVGNSKFIQVLNFNKHQNPHVREPASTIPAPGQHHASTVLTEVKNEAGPADSLIPDSLIPDSTTSPPDGDVSRCPVEDIIGLYHDLMPDNPKCKVLNPARRAAVKARWLEASRLTCRPFGYATREGGLAAWRSFFETCAESPFLTGKTKPQPGRPPFFADVDFLFSPSGFAKCIENKYHREAA